MAPDPFVTDVVLGVAGRQPQLGSRGHPPAVTAVVQPQVVPVAGPEVDDLGVREERDVDGVVGMVMAEEDMSDRLWVDSQVGERVEDEATIRNEAGVRDDQGIAIPDERDAAADMTALADVARVDQVDARHSSRW